MPLPTFHPNYNGSPCNFRIEWENEETTNEPLIIKAEDDPVSCATHDRENTLLDELGWKRFKSLAKREKKILRLKNQAKLRSYRTPQKNKFGHEAPRNNDYDHAASVDENNGNHTRADCIKLEIFQQR